MNPPFKIKVRPEDFIVEEIAHLPLSRGGPHRVYHLQKRYWNTSDIIRYLSKRLHLPLDRFSYGGKKDRYSLSTQFITIRDRRSFKINEKNFTLIPMGAMFRPMGPDLIKGNRFTITVRKVREEELQRIKDEIEIVKEYGFVNYFDDQRFRSFAPKMGFIAEHLLKGDTLTALKIILTHIWPEDKKPLRVHKRQLKQDWSNWKKCLEMASNNLEKKIFRTLSEGKGPDVALRYISREEVSMYVAAYQAGLWNELIRRIIRRHSRKILLYKGIAGHYLFYRIPSQDLLDILKEGPIPVASRNMRFRSKYYREIFNEILEERGITNRNFRIKSINFDFPSFTREVMVRPEELEVSIGDDEIYKGFKKIILSFFLPRGCYGTMFLKRLWASEE